MNDAERITQQHSQSDSDAFRSAVADAVRAPSAHNSQPWRFRIRPDGVDLRADPSRRLAVVDPDGRELAMSCGAALFTLRCALRERGYEPTVDCLPEPNDPDLLAGVHCQRSAVLASQHSQLYPAIDSRQTHRGAFLAPPLPHELLEQLRAAARAEGAWLAHIESAAEREALGDLVAEGDRLQCGDRSFRSELASWIRPNASPRADGLAGYRLGLGDFASRIAPFVVRAFDVGRRQAKADRELTVAAPALLVLGTDRDDLRHWLAAGQALQHVLLRSAVARVSAGFMNQPVQCPTLRPRLNAMLDRSGVAQLVMRLGYAEAGEPSRRRPVQDVLD